MSPVSLVVTVDVEGIPGQNDYSSVDKVVRMLETLAVPATLFVTPDVVEGRTETVRNWTDKHAVGLHIHPERLGGGTDWLAEYGRENIAEFVARGQAIFEDHLNFQPTIFRAGRWSFSEKLLEVLDDQGFERDSSLRTSFHQVPYRVRGLTEFPMTVVGGPFLRLALHRYGIDGIPLHADAFLRARRRQILFYAATLTAFVNERQYLMVSLHDYDLADRRLYRRIERYLARLADWLPAVKVTDLPEA